MGTWDTSLYGGDLPLDIKAEYYEQLCEGHTPEEAAALVWKELQLSEEDLPVFRLILADIQWKLGQMTEDTLRNALEANSPTHGRLPMCETEYQYNQGHT